VVHDAVDLSRARLDDVDAADEPIERAAPTLTYSSGVGADRVLSLTRPDATDDHLTG
jgi:hypothetical protein